MMHYECFFLTHCNAFIGIIKHAINVHNDARQLMTMIINDYDTEVLDDIRPHYD